MEEKRGKQGEPVADAVYEMLNTRKQKTRSGDDWEMNQWTPIKLWVSYHKLNGICANI